MYWSTHRSTCAYPSLWTESPVQRQPSTFLLRLPAFDLCKMALCWTLCTLWSGNGYNITTYILSFKIYSPKNCQTRFSIFLFLTRSKRYLIYMFFSEKFVCSWDWWTPCLQNATLCPIYPICAGKQVLFELQFHSTIRVSEGLHDSTHLTVLAWAHRDQPLTHGPLGAVVAHG